jgi:hypothetical protein
MSDASSGVPVVTTRSTRFFNDLTENLGFDKMEFWAIPLPEVFDEGAAGKEQFGERDEPRSGESLINGIVEAFESIPTYTDEQRVKLAAKAEKAGFSDTTMYAEYLKVYDQAVSEFGKV